MTVLHFAISIARSYQKFWWEIHILNHLGPSWEQLHSSDFLVSSKVRVVIMPANASAVRIYTARRRMSIVFLKILVLLLFSLFLSFYRFDCLTKHAECEMLLPFEAESENPPHV